MDSQLIQRISHLPKGSEEQKRILELLDCHFMSTAMLRISQVPVEQQHALEERIIEILDKKPLRVEP